MIEENQRYFNRFLTLVDALVTALMYLLSWYLRYRSRLFFATSYDAVLLGTYLRALVVIIPGLLILYSAFNLYTANRVQGRRTEIAGIIESNLIAALAVLAVLQLLRQAYWSRGMIVVFFALNTFATIAVHLAIRAVVKRMRRNGWNERRVLLIGYSRAAEEYIDRVMKNPQWGFTIRGVLDDKIEAGTAYKGIKVLGNIDNLMVILPENRLDEIVITLGLAEYNRLEEIVALCEKSGVHTRFVPDYSNIIPTRPYTEDILGLPVINIRYVPLSNLFPSAVKRGIDIIGSFILIILTSPAMLISAFLVKCTSKGPVIYKQERVGRQNKPFHMYKFRTMIVQDVDEEKEEWTTRGDPRVTSVGRFLRRTSIDELPQLFNVLKGEMSLVGPRPERPFFVEKFQEEIPRYMVKHQVRPGMTGWAQVNGFRGDTSIKKRIECDLYYIENWTIGLDLKILLMTVFRGFVNKNAY